MQFEEEPAGIAEYGANLVASPKRRSRGRAILADGLQMMMIIVSQGSHDMGQRQHRSKLQSLYKLASVGVQDRDKKFLPRQIRIRETVEMG